MVFCRLIFKEGLMMEILSLASMKLSFDFS